MNNLKLKELSKIGYINDRARSVAIQVVSKHFKHHSNEEVLALLTQIKTRPEAYIEDPATTKIASLFIEREEECNYTSYELLNKTGRLKVYGGKDIPTMAKQQMELAMSLPVAVQGALMPDAHTGYGLPIGGVLATNNAVIPYAVGVDIGCRMALSIIDEPESFLKRYAHQLKCALKEHTHFGMDGGLEDPMEHAVMDDPAFRATSLLRSLKGKAARQLGSSGGGNHFVEFGTIRLEEDNDLGLPAKAYLALLTHSGSRGLGAAIAQHYTAIAMDKCRLPKPAKQLAWLDMSSEEGQEYFLSMNLAGDYAKACHDAIHKRLLKAMGIEAIRMVENHHNFAWKETMGDGTELIVHRKGATPAHEGQLGIIPGSMATAAYLVAGKGADAALNSAAHGAGRAMSRQRAKEQMTVSAMKQTLAKAGVTLIGGSVEENPFAYKDIERVMQSQAELVDVQGVFYPKIVRMNKD